MLGKKIKTERKNFSLSDETIAKLTNWFEWFDVVVSNTQTMVSEDGKWIYLENTQVQYTSERWDIQDIAEKINAKVLHLQGLFRKGETRYEDLQDHFREVFNHDDLSDDEGEGDLINHIL